MRMEDIFKFLLVAGIIVVGIIKQFRKEAQSSEAPPSDEHGMPLPHEANPLPENWGGETYGGYIPEGPKPAEQLHTPKSNRRLPDPNLSSREETGRHHRTGSAQLRNRPPLRPLPGKKQTTLQPTSTCSR